MASSLEVNNARFNAEAVEWDNNAKHVESTQKALEVIRRYVPAFSDGTSKKLDVLELGCGTGLLSFLLAPQVRSLIGVDTASGMLSGFDAKLAALSEDDSPANLASVNTLLQSADDAALQATASSLDSRLVTSGNAAAAQRPYRFNLAVSHLTLHHIPSMPAIFKTLAECLAPGGRVALTDYEDYSAEAIAFHPIAKRDGVERHGIRRDEAVEAMRAAGFVDVVVEEAFVLRKGVEAEAGRAAREMDFPFLIMAGTKN